MQITELRPATRRPVAGWTSWFLLASASCLSVQLGANFQRQPPLERPRAKAVTGVVVDGSTGAPISEAIVELTPTDMQGRDKQNEPRRQLTDKLGRFAFLDVPADDSLTVRATRFGYLDGTYVSDPGGLITQPGIHAGQWIADVKIQIWRPAALGGTVTNEIGQPAADVWVRLLSVILVGGSDRLAPRALTTTDDRGHFRFSGLAPGRYIAEVPSTTSSQPSGSPGVDGFVFVRHYPIAPPPVNGSAFGYPAVFAPGGAVPDVDRAIELTFAEQRDGVDMSVTPVAAHSISGTLLGMPGSWSGKLIRLSSPSLTRFGLADVAATAPLGSDGTFRFSNIPDGTYALDAGESFAQLKMRAPTLAFREMDFAKSMGTSAITTTEWDMGSLQPDLQISVTRFDGMSTGYWAHETVNLSGSDATVAVPVRTATAVLVHLELQIDQRFPRPSIEPAAGLFLEAAETQALVVERSRYSGNDPTVDAELPAVPAGKYFLRTQNGWLLKSLSGSGATGPDVPIEISGRRAELSAVVTNAGATLTGTVTDAGHGGRLLALLFPSDSVADLGLASPKLRTVPVGPDGTYEIRGIPAGTYRVVAIENSSSVPLTPSSLQRLRSVSSLVNVDWGTKKVADLRASRVIQ